MENTITISAYLSYERRIDMSYSDNEDIDQKRSEALSALPLNALDDIPHPKSDAKSITGLTKHRGTITGYQLSDGQIVSKEQGVAMAKEGEISGVGVAHKGDTVYLKSLPDGSENNNLGRLPTVSAKEDRFV